MNRIPSANLPWSSNINRIILFIFSFFIFPLSIIAATCPALNCPADRDTPLAQYLFQNNLNDSSGNSLTAGDANPSMPVNYYQNIGGMSGYSSDNFAFGSGTGITIPACVIYRDEGEIDWYEYVTYSGNNYSNIIFNWQTATDNPRCMISVIAGDAAVYGPSIVRVDYTALLGTDFYTEEYEGDWLKLNQWQHFSFQWGSFGTLLSIDGVIVSGSFATWDQGAQDGNTVLFGTSWDPQEDGLYGYIADLEFWPCSSHGTMTQTPTSTVTPTLTLGPPFTITNTPFPPTYTPTFTITPTCTYSQTSTFTPTITFTFTITPAPAISFTATITPTMSTTVTITPTLIYNGFSFIGVYPSPANRTTNFIYVSYGDCSALVSVYTVSGEKVAEIDEQGKYGVNSITYGLTNSSGRQIASGIYIYKIEIKSISGNKQDTFGKFAVVR